MPGEDPLTYARAGVDVRAESTAVHSLVRMLTGRREGDIQPLPLQGHYAGGVRFGESALILCTDGVGSKVLVAAAIHRFDTVGIDCIAMNVNDAVCVGAEPVAFVDYVALDKPDPDLMRQIGKGLDAGARESNVVIVGGETAVLPELVRGFDLAGTCLAVAPANRLITGEKVQPGDAVVALPSSGLHSNGYTLARKAVARAKVPYDRHVDSLGTTVGAALLEPTRIYVRQALRTMKAVDVHGFVHVTGGGLLKFLRITQTCGYRLDGWPNVPPLFKEVQKWGSVPTADLFTTFNMGVGFAAVVSPSDADDALEALGPDAFRLGTVTNERVVDVPAHKVRVGPD